MSNTTHSSLLEKRLSERSNYFNIVRLILAFTVCIDHAGLIIEGQAETELIRLFGISLGYIAVNGFFVLSGLLICRSLERSGLTLGYFAARLLRLYPALIVFALVASLIVAPIVGPRYVLERPRPPLLPPERHDFWRHSGQPDGILSR